jgi:AraC-like DNA-binding protein
MAVQLSESARFIRPGALPGVEALHATFVHHRYAPHIHNDLTIACVDRGAATFDLEDRRYLAPAGTVFLIPPQAVHTGRSATDTGPVQPLSSLKHPAVQEAQDYIHEHWRMDFSLDQLARAVGLSPFYLARSFRSQIGMPPSAYRRALRVEAAKKLLRSGEPAVRVAASCGFYDQAHLTRHFKRVTGVTPARYASASLAT